MRASIFRVDSRVLGRVLAVALALTLTTGALAGCGSEDKPKADPSPTSKPSVPPGLDTTPPPKPEPADTEAGAVEYARYFALLVQHAIRIRNVRPVMAEALDQAKCTTCRQLSEFIEQDMRDEKEWEITPDLRLGKFRARATSGGFVVNGAFVYPSGQARCDSTAPGRTSRPVGRTSSRATWSGTKTGRDGGSSTTPSTGRRPEPPRPLRRVRPNSSTC